MAFFYHERARIPVPGREHFQRPVIRPAKLLMGDTLARVGNGLYSLAIITANEK